jgi:hypothetical protein
MPLNEVARCSAGSSRSASYLRLALARVLVGGGHQDVDAVGPAADVVVDPLQLGVDALRAHAGHAEHAQATGLRDLDDHVAAMREGEDRRLDAEHFTQAVGHAVSR